MRLLDKLCSRRGETLVETLVSIGIAAMSVSLMVLMIVTSTNLNEQARKEDEKYLAELDAAEIPSGEFDNETVIMRNASKSASVPVKVYPKDGDGFKSYQP